MHMLVTMFPDTPDAWLDLLWPAIRRLKADSSKINCHMSILDERQAAGYVASHRLPFTPVAVVHMVEKGGYTKTREYVYIGSKGALVKKPVSEFTRIPSPKDEAW